ncbi:MAG TPA: hypothetical protein VGO58_07565 [Chitinophagaceae bacterium]|jgi:hypothetical protein|nr:hypothetical protein [Chitinophagaceae bacterium]
MKKKTIHTAKSGLLVIALILSASSFAQQEVIQDKNDTRPEITRQFGLSPMVTSFIAIQNNGYNEIQWSARLEQETRRYIVEYSDDGVHFHSAGEAVSTTGNYLLKHQTFTITPLLYRLRIESMEGRSVYSQSILLSGIKIDPVKIYPTIISGNTVNLIADFPVERIAVFAGNGQQVFTKEIGGKMESITVVLPALGKGMYWMHFIGQGWKTTSQFIVP